MKRIETARRLLLGLTILIVSLLLHAAPASAANPTTISFQGKVVNANGTNVTDGSYSFLFKLYTVSSGGTAVWTETQSSVTVTSGVFQVNLGSSCSFFVPAACNGSTPIDFNANPALYLGITFNSDPAGEMTPRVQLQSVPYAYNADKVGGFSVAQLVQLSPGSAQSGFVNVSGNITSAAIVQGGTVTATGALQGATLSVDSGIFAVNAAGAISASSGITSSGIVNVQASSYTTSLALINDGQVTAPPAFPNSYTPALTVITAEVAGSRPLFFGYNSGAGSYGAYLTSGACGAFTQMCLDLGSGATNFTAFENVGTTLEVGGGDDGNFATTTLISAATSVSGTLGVTGLASLNGGTATTTLTSTGTTSLSGTTTFATTGDIYGNGFNYFDPSLMTGASTPYGSGGAAGGNFGGVFDSGAFIGEDSSYGMEFVAAQAATTTNNSNFGDSGNWYSNTAGSVAATSFSAQTIANATAGSASGYFQFTAPTTTARGGLLTTGSTPGTQDKPLLAANLPIIQMKVRPSVLRITDDFAWGIGDTATAPTANDSLPANGIVFWTNNSTGAGGWTGVVRSGGATIGTPVVCPGGITANAWATGRIVVVNATTVRFFIDVNSSDGINFVDCGTVTGTLPTAAMALQLNDAHNVNTAATFGLDYARWWQDDAPVTDPAQAAANISAEQTEADISTGNDGDNTVDSTQIDAISHVPADPVNSVVSNTSPAIQTNVPVTSTNNSNLQITVNGTNSFQITDQSGKAVATIDEGGNASFDGNLNLPNGALTVGGDITVGGLSTFQKLATFLAKAVFKQDVQIDGHLIVGDDSAGYASLRTGEKTVHVAFKQAYDSPPVVNANITSGQFSNLSVTNITTQGFDINLAAPATEATSFSWSAIGVTNPQTATNPLGTASTATTSSN